MSFMSTNDPDAARRQRLKRPPGVPRIVTSLLLGLVAGLTTGYALAVMTLAGESDPPTSGVVTFVACLPLMIAASALWSTTVFRSKKLGIGPGLLVFFTGYALGAWCAGQIVGFGTVANWMVGVSAALALFFAVMAPLGIRARRSAAALENDAVNTGIATTATVTSMDLRGFDSSSVVITGVTFTFTDNHGTQRWVRKRMRVYPEAPVGPGHQTTLSYDPLDPGNEKKIVVQLVAESGPK